MKEKLEADQYKLTVRREQVLRVLLENKDKHLSAAEVYYLAKRKAPDMSLATVYRTLELFLLQNIIYIVDFGDGRRRYEFYGWVSDNCPHYHLICTQCGSVIEVHEDFPGGLENRVGKEHKFKVQSCQLKIFGICKKCALKTLKRLTG